VLAKNSRLCTQLVASACKICFRVALSSIVPAHFPNQISKGRQLKSQNRVADFIHVACDWRPLRYNLHATGGHPGTILMRPAASCMQTLHALAASCNCKQSRQFFASTLGEQLFELKNEDAIKLSENLCET
jgi:hypothetical protein